MNTHRIEKVLKQIEESKNYKDFTKLLLFEERKQLVQFLTENEESDDFIDEYPIINDDDLLINFFTEEEAAEIYSNDFHKLNEEFKCIVMCNLSLNQIKKAFKKYMPDDEVVRLVLIKIPSDKERIEFVEKYLQNLPNNEKISALALSLNNDNLKLQYLYIIPNEYNKARVLESLKDDNLKLKYLDILESDYIKADVITSLKDDNLKLQYLKTLSNDDELKVDVIASLKDDNFKLKYLSSLATDKAKAQLIIRLEDDNLKLQYLHIFTDENTKANIIASLKDNNLKLQYLDSITNIQDKAGIIASLKDDNLKLQYLKKLPTDDVKEKIIANIRNLKIRIEALAFLDNLSFYFYRVDWLNEIKSIDDDIHKEIIKKIAQENNLNYDNLLRLFLKLGYGIRNLGNLKKIVNLKQDEFEKIIQIIDIGKNSKLTMVDVKAITETLYEREYRINNRADLLIFSRLQHSISNKNKNEILNILIKINEIIDINNILKENNINPNTFVDSLLENKNIDVLHIITDKYLDEKRELYKIERRKNATNELNLDYDFDKKYLLSKLFQKFDINYIYDFIKNEINGNKLLDDSQIELLNNETLFIECLKFKKDEEHYPKDEFSKIKVKLRALNGILNILYEEKKLNFLGNKKEKNAIILKPKETESRDFIKLLNELDIDMIKDKLLTNPLIYEKLLDILRKYKFMNWSNIFENLLKSTDLSFNKGELATLINYFYDFYPKLENQKQNKLIKDIRISNILDELRTYGSCSIRYRYLLGKEDSELIISNPNPNSSSLKVEERLRKIPNEILIQYKRKYITVPPMNEDILLKNGKKIHANIGDTTSPINLTYGERTGACMRIGGIGNSLFDFCLENENGFHIRLTNPANGNFISRVSGFRNGNTVFLNQLRYSMDKSISNFDLIETIDIIAKKIVESTKGSKYPIKNVIISDGYVMEARTKDKTTLNVQNVKEGYKDFYSDVSNFNAIYLEKNDEIELGPEKAEKYDVSRKKIVCFENMKDIIEQMQKFNLINGLLKGESLGNISLISEDAIMNIGKIYVGEDFLLAYDYEGNLITKLILDREEHFKEKANSETNTLINFLNENSIENERGKTR